MTKAKKPSAGSKPRTAKKIADPVPVVVAAVEPVAQGDGDPAPIGRAEFDTLKAELDRVTALVVPPQAEPDTFTSDEHGRMVAPKGSRELFIRVGGVRHEHVAETADGRWVYSQS